MNPTDDRNPLDDLDSIIVSLDGLAALIAASDGMGGFADGLAENLTLHCQLLRAISRELHHTAAA
jgi:hypothetical protein